LNSIEAIIALTIMLGGFGIIISSINEMQNDYNESSDILRAKTQAINCAAIIDSIYSNSATTRDAELNCLAERFEVKAKYNNKTKESQTAAETANELAIEVKTLDHYIK